MLFCDLLYDFLSLKNDGNEPVFRIRNFYNERQCGSGSGFVGILCFWTLVRFRVPFYFYCFLWLLHDCISLKNDVNLPVFRIRIRTRRIHKFLDFPDPHRDALVRGTDPRIRICFRIRTKMSRIRNTDKKNIINISASSPPYNVYVRFFCVIFAVSEPRVLDPIIQSKQ